MHSTIVWNVLSYMHFSYRKSFIDTNDGGEHIIVFRRIMCMLYLEFEKLSQQCSTMSFHPTPEAQYYFYKYMPDDKVPFILSSSKKMF